MKASDMTINTVAGRLNVHRSTVKRLFSQYRRTGKVTDAEYPGRCRSILAAGILAGQPGLSR
ncbi:MAG: hypothetical protein GY774_03770 [Planctomycetes bacterium]|nr:hypothetical protein [Planctomycetota bacterium]